MAMSIGHTAFQMLKISKSFTSEIVLYSPKYALILCEFLEHRAANVKVAVQYLVYIAVL